MIGSLSNYMILEEWLGRRHQRWDHPGHQPELGQLNHREHLHLQIYSRQAIDCEAGTEDIEQVFLELYTLVVLFLLYSVYP